MSRISGAVVHDVSQHDDKSDDAYIKSVKLCNFIIPFSKFSSTSTVENDYKITDFTAQSKYTPSKSNDDESSDGGDHHGHKKTCNLERKNTLIEANDIIKLRVQNSQQVALKSNPFPPGFVDVHGQQLDFRRTNSWACKFYIYRELNDGVYLFKFLFRTVLKFNFHCLLQVEKLGEVSVSEAAECMAINALAPFAINSELVDLMTVSLIPIKEKSDIIYDNYPSSTNTTCNVSNNSIAATFIVNVSAMEGKFYRHKTANHPHTNMAKAALNMMTRTCAGDLAKKGIYMTSVDTGLYS